MRPLEFYRNAFLEKLSDTVPSREPVGLYEPVRYILEIGGKRVRPLLTLMSAEVFDTDYLHAMDAAMAVELFHNFSLIHDDIMDEAPLRRGNQTVHEKWNLNTGILSGDAMLILAYRYFEGYEPEIFRELAKLFSKTALEVCEGQQWDVDFETRDDVSVTEYLKMIEYKTAVLLGAAMEMGAIVARTSGENRRTIYEYGRLLGIAFQLQDDYLDAFGNPETFGKQVGGDILENKKTYLYLKAMEFGSEVQKKELLELYQSSDEGKIEKVKSVFLATGASDATLQAIESYTQSAFDVLNRLTVDDEKKSYLKNLGERLMNRKS